MAKTRLYIDVEYDDKITDGESIASAMDTLMETALSTPDIFEEYGNPSVGDFYVQWDLGSRSLDPEGASKEDWENLIVVLEENFDGSLLDQLVHDLKSNDASRINNDGIAGQVQCIREAIGSAAYKTIVMEVKTVATVDQLREAIGIIENREKK